ncbi:hypothetical protein ACH5RR_039599 [Cinchona calisaya]|uniref:Uncharacterized protein n=1 Tax=Cinchona calisaya TaxID=153742 RepID=A0ABD2Y0F1_9GENT
MYKIVAMMDWILVETKRPKQMTSVIEYFENFEDWRTEMLALKPKLDGAYFIEKLSIGLDWIIQLKLWEFRSSQKILFEAYLWENFEEVAMKKFSSMEGTNMEYKCADNGRENMEANGDEE